MAYEPAISLHPTIKTLRPELPSVMQVAGSETPTTSSASGGRHRPSKTPRLKRAFSSPNVGGAMEGEHAQLSSMDKKRNKLGYHRTAVACGHCRRRKIRCITANDDTTGRCQNCIRLKKDCQFFPVDQQGLSPGTRPGQDSRNEDNVDEGRGESVSSSSPRVLTSSTLEQIRNANGQVGTPPLTDDGSGYRSFGGAGSTHEYNTPHEYDYRHGYAVQPQHAYQYPSHPQHRTGFDAVDSRYYPSQEYAVRQSPYTSPPLSGSMKQSPDANTHDFPHPSPSTHEFSWTPQPPVRSMSIADTQDLHGMYAGYGRSNTFPSIPQRMAAPEEVTHMPHGHSDIIHASSQQRSYPAPYPPSTYHQMPLVSNMPWSSTIPTQIPHTPVSTSASYQQNWYPTSASLPYVHEEDASVPHLPSQHSSQQRFRPNPG